MGIIHIAIDTNIYLFCALLTKNQHNPGILEEFVDLLDRNNVTLLVPEVVEIEFYRKLDEVFEEIKAGINSYKKIFRDEFPPYLNEDKQKMLGEIDGLIKTRVKSLGKAKILFERLLSHANTRRLELTETTMLNAFKRELRGIKPYNRKNEGKKKVDYDCLIVELIIKYCKENDIDELIICTDNISDFAEYNEETKRHELHSDILKDLPKGTILCTKLTELLKVGLTPPEKEKLILIDKEFDSIRIQGHWNLILEQIKGKSKTLNALLCEGYLGDLKDGKIAIKFPEDRRFHKEMSERFKVMVEETIQEVIGNRIDVNFVLDEKNESRNFT